MSIDKNAAVAQEVEHILGKDEVTSSSLVSSSTKKHTVLGVPIRDYKKTKIILMGTPASEYRKESSNFFELSLCVEFIFAKENLFKLCIDYEKSI